MNKGLEIPRVYNIGLGGRGQRKFEINLVELRMYLW